MNLLTRSYARFLKTVERFLFQIGPLFWFAGAAIQNRHAPGIARQTPVSGVEEASRGGVEQIDFQLMRVRGPA
jgi:hypothetical protein